MVLVVHESGVVRDGRRRVGGGHVRMVRVRLGRGRRHRVERVVRVVMVGVMVRVVAGRHHRLERM